MIPNDRSPFEGAEYNPGRRIDASQKNADLAELALETAIAAVLDPTNPTQRLSFVQATRVEVKLTISSYEDIVGVGATRREALANLLVHLARVK